MKWLRRSIQDVLATRGYVLKKLIDPSYEDSFVRIHHRVKDLTMTPIERQHALFAAIMHLSKKGIQGDIVECGVWKGGSAMIAALALMEAHDTDRSIYMYDTYAGMSEPTTRDVSFQGGTTMDRWKQRQQESHNEWDYASLEEVKSNMHATGYPEDKLRFVQGKVEERIPGVMPEKIALLRLDTDWYESTRHELEHLFPRLVEGGILIIDDYGHWKGAHDAVDEYFAQKNITMFLHRTDYSGRIGEK